MSQAYLMGSNLKDYFFAGLRSLPTYGLPDYKRVRVDKAKEIVNSIVILEGQGRRIETEQAVHNLITPLT